MSVKLLFLDDKMEFGYHKGKTVAAVIRENPSYLNWALKHTNKVNLSLEVAAALKAAMDDRGYREKYPNGSLVVARDNVKTKRYRRVQLGRLG